MKRIFKAGLSIVMTLAMLCSLVGLFTLPAAADTVAPASFQITVGSGVTPNLHNMTLSIASDAFPKYNQSTYLQKLLAYYRASSKTAKQQAATAIANYIATIKDWLDTFDTEAGAQFYAMCRTVDNEAETYYNNHSNSLTGFQTSYTVLYSYAWQRTLATDEDLTNGTRGTWHSMASGSNRTSYNAAYVASTKLDNVKDLTKTTCIRARITVRILNEDNPSTGYNTLAYSQEIQIAPHEYHAAVPAGCTTDGTEEYYICPDCGEKVSFYTNGTCNNETGNGTASARLKIVDDEGLTIPDSALGHDYVPVVTPPTCDNGGYTTYTCSRCGDAYVVDATEPTGHVWDEGVITTPATCAADGVTLYTCTVCGATKEEAIPALPHTTNPDDPWLYKYIESSDRAYRYHVCTVCGGEVDIDEPHALNITFTSTCGLNKMHGMTVHLDHDYPVFSVEEYVNRKVQYLTGGYYASDYMAWIGYTEFFRQWFTINGRASIFNKMIEKIDEQNNPYAAIPLVILELNYDMSFYNGEYHYLSNMEGSADAPDYSYANSVDDIDLSIQPQNADFDYSTIVKITGGLSCKLTWKKAETNQFDGSTSGYLGFFTKNVSTITKHETGDATCEQAGALAEYYCCDLCGESYALTETDGTPFTVSCPDGVTRKKLTLIDRGDYELPALGGTHTYDEGVVTAPATCLEDGVRTFTCTRCGLTYTEAIPALGHDIRYFTIDPTCTEPGANVHGCMRCDYVEESTEIPALGHDYVATVVAPTCTEGGYTSHVCSRCGDTYTDAVTDPTGHTADENGWYYLASDPDFNDHPVRYHICTVCGGACDKAEPVDPVINWTYGHTSYHNTKVTQQMDFPRFDTAEYVALYNAYLALPEGEEKDAAYAQAFGYRRFHRQFACVHNGQWSQFDAMVDAIEADPAYALAHGYGITYYYDIIYGVSGSNPKSLNTMDGCADHSFTNVPLFDFSVFPRETMYSFRGSWDFQSVLYGQLNYGTYATLAPLRIDYSGSVQMFLTMIAEVAPTCTTAGCRQYFHCGSNNCHYFSLYTDADTINYVVCDDGIMRAKLVDLGANVNNVKAQLAIPATGHTPDGDWIYSADGTQRWHVCAECGEIFDLEDVPAGQTGDVNLDGIVDITDVTALLNVLSGGTAEGECDLNGDGIVDIIDVTTLLNILGGTT